MGKLRPVTAGTDKGKHAPVAHLNLLHCSDAGKQSIVPEEKQTSLTGGVNCFGKLLDPLVLKSLLPPSNGMPKQIQRSLLEAAHLMNFCGWICCPVHFTHH